MNQKHEKGNDLAELASIHRTIQLSKSKKYKIEMDE